VENSKVWARPGLSLPPQYAAFVNGVAVGHFKYSPSDTWYELVTKINNFCIIKMVLLEHTVM